MFLSKLRRRMFELCLGMFFFLFCRTAWLLCIWFTIKSIFFFLNSSHGQLKSVRLPKKFNSRSRGFAFLEFISRHEAENAYAALRHTHLLGRHLVLEWAEEAETDLEALRKKAGVGFGGGKDMPGRKRKLNLGGKTGEEDDDDEDLG